MAAPAYWKGYLKLSLVTCAVSLTPATTESEKVRFHTINKTSGRRVRSHYVDAETGEAVEKEDEVKGYETSDGQFVTFESEELEAVALESVHTIDVDRFVPADSISWIWLDTPYYVHPTDKVGEEAFTVIREAMTAKDVVGLSQLVLHNREHSVMLEPRGKGIVLWTLRYGDEVRDTADYFGKEEKGKADPKLMTMVKKIIEERSEHWDPKMVKDPVQAKLKSIIAAKSKKPGKKVSAKKDEEAPAESSNVISLMDALKKSLEKPDRKSGGK